MFNSPNKDVFFSQRTLNNIERGDKMQKMIDDRLSSHENGAPQYPRASGVALMLLRSLQQQLSVSSDDELRARNSAATVTVLESWALLGGAATLLWSNARQSQGLSAASCSASSAGRVLSPRVPCLPAP